MIRRILIAWMGLAALCLALGCSAISALQSSSQSFSDSSSALSDSIGSVSRSSSPENEQGAAFRRDVRDHTIGFAASRGDVRAFQRDLGAIAESHGVTDWERLEGTYLAIGQGLAKAGVSPQRYEELAIELSNENPGRLALVRAGYENQRSQ